MRKVNALIGVAAVIGFALLALACSGIQQGVQVGKEAYNLTLVGQAYQEYCDTNKKGPADVDALLNAADAQHKDAIQQVKDGKFTVIFGVNLSDPAVKSSGAVLGYAPAPVNGQRVVLLTDNPQAQAIPESTFQSKPKATAGGGSGKDKKP